MVMKRMELKDYRKKIDKTDAELLRLFKERMSIAKEIALYKKERGIPVYDPARESEKLSAMPDVYARKLFTALFELSREYQSAETGNQPENSHKPEKRILIINGPNLNMLGVREPDVYGNKSYADLTDFIRTECDKLRVDCECIQSNHEGALIDAIQSARGKFDGIVINPAAYTHTSIAIYDALKAAEVRAIEVHLSDISAREDFRKISYVSKACEKTIAGKGFEGYAEAIRLLIQPV